MQHPAPTTVLWWEGYDGILDLISRRLQSRQVKLTKISLWKDSFRMAGMNWKDGAPTFPWWYLH